MTQAGQRKRCSEYAASVPTVSTDRRAQAGDEQAVDDVAGEVGAAPEQHVGVVGQRRRERKLAGVDGDLLLERCR